MAYTNKADQVAAARRHYEANKEIMKQRAATYSKNLRADMRTFLNQYKVENPCTDCGKYYPAHVMQFDHVRGVKKFNVSDLSKASSWKRLHEEIAKCELVCGNCHADRTHNRRGMV